MRKNKLDEVAENIIAFLPSMYRQITGFEKDSQDNAYYRSQYPVLCALKRNGSMPLSEVGRMLNISKSRMTLLANRLIAEKKITKVSSKEDARRTYINITKTGEKFLLKSKKRLKENIKRKFAGMDSKDINLLLSSLVNIKTILQKMHCIKDSKK